MNRVRKGGGSEHTPYEQPDNLKSKQKAAIIDCIGEGPIEGPLNGLQSVLLNMTPVVDSSGNSNVNGMTVQWVAGTQEQPALPGFEGSGAEVAVGAEIKHDAPITRTITSENIDRLRLTFGVSSLVHVEDDGDRRETSVSMQIQIRREGAWVTERNITISGKTTTQFLSALVLDNLPARPFDIRMVRTTEDSTSDTLQNSTLWASYTEIIDVKQRYPNTAVVGVTFDSEQFGGNLPTRNYHIRGRIVQIPSNYDPIARTYTGLWDGSFIPAWTDNPAWCLYDMLTHPRYGLGRRIGMSDVDKFQLYIMGQYADVMVPDGYGGMEPRMRCNAYITDKRSAYDVINDFCSIMRCMPVWNGTVLTFVQDRPADKVWPYTNANVVEGKFTYTFSAKKSRHNAVLVRFINPDNGWKDDYEYVSDDLSIASVGLNQLEIDAFACTSRGQAHRHGLWALTTEKYEIQTVNFKVGAEGLRHIPGDIIEVADNNYVSHQVGGRILSVDSARRQVQLDRDVELPNEGVKINLIDSRGQPVNVDVKAHPSPDTLVLDSLPDGVTALSVWSLTLPSLRERLFRCLSIKEDRDTGTYEITALQHVPEKEAIVDNGASFDPDPATDLSTIPPAVEHLVVDVTPDSDQYQALSRWDTPRVVNGVRFEIKLNRGDRIVDTQTTSAMEYRFKSLSLGDYQLTVRAVTAMGLRGDPSSMTFSIDAPEAPVYITLTPGYFQITITPRQSYYQSGTQFEFWFSETQITDIRLVESEAQLLGTANYWVKDNLQKLGTDYYFYVRSVNTVGQSAFVEAVGQVNSDASGTLDILSGQITSDQLTQDFLDGIDNNLVREEFNQALKDSEAAVNQRMDFLESDMGDTTSQLSTLAQAVADGDSALSQRIDNVNALAGENSAAVQTVSKAQADLEGNTAAMWTMQVESTADGQHAIGGIQATAVGGFSQILLIGDRVAILNPENGSAQALFVVQNGQIIMADTFIKSLNVNGRFVVTPDGELSIRADTSSNVGLKMNSSLIQINDEQGRPAIKLGDTWATL